MISRLQTSAVESAAESYSPILFQPWPRNRLSPKIKVQIPGGQSPPPCRRWDRLGPHGRTSASSSSSSSTSGRGTWPERRFPSLLRSTMTAAFAIHPEKSAGRGVGRSRRSRSPKGPPIPAPRKIGPSPSTAAGDRPEETSQDHRTPANLDQAAKSLPDRPQHGDHGRASIRNRRRSTVKVEHGKSPDHLAGTLSLENPRPSSLPSQANFPIPTASPACRTEKIPPQSVARAR